MRRAALAAALLAAALLITLDALWHFEAIQSLNRLGRADSSATAGAGAGPSERRSVFRDGDAMMWNLNAAEVAAGRALRVRRTDFDNHPLGRESHWSSGYAWLLASGGRLWAAIAGEGIRAAIEKASLLVNPALHLGLVVAFAAAAARRFTGLAGALGVLAVAGSRTILGTFSADGPDHHGLITAASLFTLTGLFFGGAGFVRTGGSGAEGRLPGGFGLPDEKSARRWFTLSALSAAAGLWVSAASMTFLLAGVGVALLASLAFFRGARDTDVRFAPELWRRWGTVGALTGLFFYLLEYFPRQMGWRLEVNHPLYHAAWWGGSRLLALAGGLRFSGHAPRRREWAEIAAASIALAAPPALILAGGERFHSLRAGVLQRMTETVFEFMPVRLPGFLAEFGPLIAVWLAAAALLPRARMGREPRAWVAFGLATSLLPLGLTFRHQRWGSLLAVALALAPLATLAVGARALGNRRGWRALGAALSALLLAQFALVGSRQLAFSRGLRAQPMRDLNLSATAATREAAEFLRHVAGNRGAVVLSTATPSVELGYYGGFRTVNSIYWENLAGMNAALDILTARDDREALRLLRGRGITHLAFPVSDFNPRVLFYLKHGRPGSDAEVGETFAGRLASGTGPGWARRAPFISAVPEFRSSPAFYGVALFLIDPPDPSRDGARSR